MNSEFRFLKLGPLVVGLVMLPVACSDDETNPSTPCSPGEWHVTTTMDPCFGEPKTVQDSCVVLAGPTAVFDSLSARGLFPPGCEPTIDENTITIDCTTSVWIDSVLIAMGDSVNAEIFANCEGTISVDGGGEYAADWFDYRYETWISCGRDCGFDAQTLCYLAQSTLGGPACPTVNFTRGEYQ